MVRRNTYYVDFDGTVIGADGSYHNVPSAVIGRSVEAFIHSRAARRQMFDALSLVQNGGSLRFVHEHNVAGGLRLMRSVVIARPAIYKGQPCALLIALTRPADHAQPEEMQDSLIRLLVGEPEQFEHAVPPFNCCHKFAALGLDAPCGVCHDSRKCLQLCSGDECIR